MYELEKIFCFEAAHFLNHHDGKCKSMHGHSYSLHVIIRKESLQKEGPKKNMVIDFQDLADLIQPMLKKYLDHQCLNETLQSDSTTVEFVCKWIYDYLKPMLPELYAITLYETASSKATYWM
ncbi:6-carboxytetrahydropterin synthase QueD [Neochlamydia sp. S13]|uniref:6-carboxytetrahydropterin synthase QueD n=1 Tax=Neochlamydia sp. S13 TaxID=1353976 RepID=UPI0005A837F0|nr:6-carboxytetrahydropterin synthase QueD [Neochlamydia sp. S13]BBI18322.1 Similar to 6-pyruvoyl tetrahydrobiopterin synthase [Neochlamydia sp. S13]